jgi:hypothetical protein
MRILDMKGPGTPKPPRYKNRLRNTRINHRARQVVALCFILLLVGWGTTAYYLELQINKEKPCPVTYVNVTKKVANNTTAVAKKAVAKPSATPSVAPSWVPPVATPMPPVVTLLYFTAGANCSVCVQQDPAIQAIATSHTVQTYLSTDTNSTAVFTQYNVVSTPTTIVLKNGVETTRFVGLTDEATILAAMN